jgi:hypothetical protein
VNQYSIADIGCEVGFNTEYIDSLNDIYFQTSHDNPLYSHEVMEGQLKDPVEGNILKIKYYDNQQDSFALNVYGQTDDGSMLLKNSQVFKYKNTDGTLNPICDLDG